MQKKIYTKPAALPEQEKSKKNINVSNGEGSSLGFLVVNVKARKDIRKQK